MLMLGNNGTFGVYSLILLLSAMALTSLGQDVIQIDTNLVTVPVAVVDRQGRSITGLGKDDFNILEGGVTQEIAFFAPTQQGSAIMVLVDNSCGMDWSEINKVVNTLAHEMHDNDTLVIGTICDDMAFRIVLSPTKKTLLKRPIRLEPLGHYVFPNTFDVLGQTFAYMKRFKGAKAILLLTHGELYGRNTSSKDLLREAEEQGAAVYPIRFGEFPNADTDSIRAFDTGQRIASDHTWSSADNASVSTAGVGPPPLHTTVGSGPKDLARLLKNVREFFQSLAQKTGGRNYELSSIADLSGTLRSIVDELGQRYTLGYVPMDPPKNGERRKIQVKVNVPEAAVIARKEVIYKLPKK